MRPDQAVFASFFLQMWRQNHLAMRGGEFGYLKPCSLLARKCVTSALLKMIVVESSCREATTRRFFSLNSYFYSSTLLLRYSHLQNSATLVLVKNNCLAGCFGVISILFFFSASFICFGYIVCDGCF